MLFPDSLFKRRSFPAAWLLALSVILVSVTGCSQQGGAGENSGTPTPGTNTTQTPLPPPVPQKHGQIYTVAQNATGDGDNLMPRTVVFAQPQSPARSALDALIAAKDSPLPPGTQLQSLTLQNGLATVNFSSAFKNNFHGGETQESQTVNAILRTLGQFSTIEHVQILVNSAKIESIGGSLVISDPLDVIRPDPIQQAKTTEGETHP